MEPDGALLQLHPPAQHSRLRAIRCTRRQGLRISPARSPTVLGPPPAPSTDHIGAHSANPLGWLVESNPRHLTDNSCPRSSGKSANHCPALRAKIFLFPFGANHFSIRGHPGPHRGRFAIVTDVGQGMRWTQAVSKDE